MQLNKWVTAYDGFVCGNYEFSVIDCSGRKAVVLYSNVPNNLQYALTLHNSLILS